MAKDKKIYHRNKGNKKFSQRFNRKRLEDSVHEIHGNKVYFEGIETDDYWNPYGQVNRDFFEDFHDKLNNESYNDGLLEQFETRLKGQLLKICNSPFNQIGLKDLSKSKNENDNNHKNTITNKSNSLEECLFRYYEYLSNISYNDLDTIISEVVEHILRFNEQDYLFEQDGFYYEKIRLALFAPFWVRKPSDWDSGSNDSLAEYVFGYYTTPKFLNSIWDESRFYFNLKYIDDYLLFVLLAQGGSLKKLSRLANWQFKRRTMQYLYKVPEDMHVTDGLLLAEVYRKGGTLRELNIIKNGDLEHHYDVFNRHNENFEFIDSTIDWVIRYRNSLSDVELSLILNWAHHEKIEAERNQLKPFSWKGRRPERTLQRAEEYHQMILESRNNNLYWEKNGLDWEYNENWHFLELTSSYDLNDEGLKQNHCVGAYDYHCSKGITAIVSMRNNNMPKLTIEISLNNKQIRQVRGKNNRLPTKEEKRVLTAWIRAQGINVDRY